MPKLAAGNRERPAMACQRIPGSGADSHPRRSQGARPYADYTREEQRSAYCVAVGGWSFALLAVLIFAALIMRGL